MYEDRITIGEIANKRQEIENDADFGYWMYKNCTAGLIDFEIYNFWSVNKADFERFLEIFIKEKEK